MKPFWSLFEDNLFLKFSDSRRKKIKTKVKDYKQHFFIHLQLNHLFDS